MGEAYESVTIETKDHVALVTLIGPGKGNSMGPAFWSEMPEVFAALDADRDVRAIVITGSGKNFSYGLDVPAMGGMFAPLMAEGALARPRTDFHAEVLRMQKAINAVADCRTPTIASVHGWCIGGAVDLISAVDIRYASADAKFSVREVKLAIVADIADNPPLAVYGVKDVLDQQRTSAVSENLRYVAAWNAAFLPSKDLTEGISATFAKRPPQFTGE